METGGRPGQILPQIGLPDVYNCSFFLEEEEDEETLAVDDDNPDDDDDDDNDSEVPQKRQVVTVSNVLVLVIQARFDLRRATFAVGPFIHPRLDERSEASYMRFFLSAPNDDDGLRYKLVVHAVCLPGGRVDPIGSDTEEFEQLRVLSRQPPRGAYCINLIDTVSTRCARFSVDFTFAVVYPLAPNRPEEISLVLSPDGISRSRFHCRGELEQFISRDQMYRLSSLRFRQVQQFLINLESTTTMTTTTINNRQMIIIPAHGYLR